MFVIFLVIGICIGKYYKTDEYLYLDTESLENDCNNKYMVLEGEEDSNYMIG